MWWDNDSVIHIMEPANGLMGYLLKPLHEEAFDNKRQWQTHSHAITDTAAEVQVSTWQRSLRISSLKCQPRLASKHPSLSIQFHISASHLLCLLPASCWFLALQLWRWRWNGRPKCQLTFNSLHSVTSQNTEWESQIWHTVMSLRKILTTFPHFVNAWFMNFHYTEMC